MVILTWEDVEALALNIVDRTPPICKYVYGVPRGGIYPALIVSQHSTLRMIESLEEAHKEGIARAEILVVDDIYDTGKTRRKYKKYRFQTLLVRTLDWVEFPWERMLGEKPKCKERRKRIDAEHGKDLQS